MSQHLVKNYGAGCSCTLIIVTNDFHHTAHYAYCC